MLYASTSSYIYNYTVLYVIICNRLLLVSNFLHIILYLHHLLFLHHLILRLLLLLLLTSDRFLLGNLSFRSIHFGQIIGVLYSVCMLLSSAVVESLCAQISPGVIARLKLLLILTGPKPSYVPFKIESTRWRC